VIAVSFMPVFTLAGMEGRLFKPLAFTKNFSMAIAAVLAITLDRRYDCSLPIWTLTSLNQISVSDHQCIIVGKIHSEESHPISRPLMKIYHPICEFTLRFKWLTVIAAVIIVQ